LERCGAKADIKVTLTKNIPAGSGLGSASSDAASTLIGLNEQLGLPLERGELMELAPELGSDVAFFLGGPLAMCSGKGEKIKKIDEEFDFAALLVLPDVTVSTKEVYANYRHDAAVYERLRTEINRHIEKNRIDLISGMCANILERSCFDLYRELAELKAAIESLGIRPVCLSGSGSAFFHISQGSEVAQLRQIQHKLNDTLGCKSVIVSNIRW
jgi:4-diphosphocytidyl-2-C-methyl-D-erythritol kinase